MNSNNIPEIYFFFDSKNIFSLLSRNPKPEVFEIFDKGDEFQCVIKVEGVESLNIFYKYLKDQIGLDLKNIEDLTMGIWDYANDILNEKYSEEETEKILNDSYEYLKSLFDE